MDNPYTFLVVDDSYIDRLVSGMMIRHTFNSKEVFEVNGGAQALEWLKNGQLNNQNHLVILLDIMMPQMNGFEFLIQFDKVMANLQNKTTVIMLSSTIDNDDIRQAKNHPYVKTFLSKPLSPNLLVEFLK